jgi:SAM-dependent methyltransferase
MRIQNHSLPELRDLADLAVLIAAASEAGIFRSLHDEPGTAEEVAARLGYDGRAVRITLTALAESGLLEREGERLALAPSWRPVLGDPQAAEYAAGGLPLWLHSLKGWTRLGEALARGGPLEAGPKRRSPEEVARFMAGMAAAPRERVERLVDLCLERCRSAESVLDVGGGPGHMCRAFVARGLRGILFDRPGVLDHVTEAYGLTDIEGLTTVSGDLVADGLPDGPHDIVLISNVVHIYAPDVNRRLLAEAGRVVRPGGIVAVAEFLRGRSAKAARFGVQMLLKSDGGDAYSEAQITEWLDEAGFAGVQVADLDPDRQLLTAVKG